MVSPSIDGSAVYSAVDLDAALNFAMKKQQSELLEMEARKRELKELAKQQRLRPPENSSTLKMLNGSRTSSPPRQRT
ncbi:MAG: hypothetical protein ACXVIL_10065 [Halobacteriota archaeon]